MKYSSLQGRKLLAAGIIAAFVAGCGGGGGGSTSSDAVQPSPNNSSATQTLPPSNSTPVASTQPVQPADPTPVVSTQVFDIEKGMNSYFMNEATYKLKASDAAGHVYEVTETITPITSTRFLNIDPNNDIRGSFESTTFYIDGKVQKAIESPFSSDSSWSVLYFKMGSPFTVNGYSEFNTLKPIAQAYPLPATAKVGESGDLALVAEKTFVDGTKAEQDLFGWALEADTAETAWLCFTERTLVTVGTTSSKSEVQAKRCSKITPAGAVIGAKADVYSDTETLRFR